MPSPAYVPLISAMYGLFEWKRLDPAKISAINETVKRSMELVKGGIAEGPARQMGSAASNPYASAVETQGPVDHESGTGRRGSA